jgi:hypothetical protein
MGHDFTVDEAVEDWIDGDDNTESASRDSTVSVVKVVSQRTYCPLSLPERPAGKIQYLKFRMT